MKYFLPVNFQDHGGLTAEQRQEFHIRTTNETLKALANPSLDSIETKKIRMDFYNHIKQNLFSTIGYDGLEYLATKRDQLGRYEGIAMIEIHGGGKPWTVSPTAESFPVGTTNQLVDSFIRESRISNPLDHLDRIILMACNAQHDRLVINQDGVAVNYNSSFTAGYNPPTPMEAKKGEVPQRIR